MKKILLINGSPNGNKGNTNQIIELCEKMFESKKIQIETIHLNNFVDPIQDKLNSADGFVITTGTYWDSWGSPMQRFFEEITPFEGKSELLFKPCAVIVTMHAYGGKEILSRIQGVLNTMGLMIPPMSGMVYSLSTQEAIKSKTSFAKDFWSLEDLEVVLHNLETSILGKYQYIAWEVDRLDPKRRWITCENL